MHNRKPDLLTYFSKISAIEQQLRAELEAKNSSSSIKEKIETFLKENKGWMLQTYIVDTLRSTYHNWRDFMQEIIVLKIEQLKVLANNIQKPIALLQSPAGLTPDAILDIYHKYRHNHEFHQFIESPNNLIHKNALLPTILNNDPQNRYYQRVSSSANLLRFLKIQQLNNDEKVAPARAQQIQHIMHLLPPVMAEADPQPPIINNNEPVEYKQDAVEGQEQPAQNAEQHAAEPPRYSQIAPPRYSQIIR